MAADSVHRWMVTGASGQLGTYIVSLLAQSVEPTCLLACSHSRAGRLGTVPMVPLEISDESAVWRAVREFRPTRIVHLAAVTAVGFAVEHPDETARTNVDAVRFIQQAAAETGAHLTFTSTDMVFDGSKANWTESDAMSPLSVYGRSKGEAETWLIDQDHVAIVRLPLMYGVPLTARRSTFADQVEALRAGRELTLFHDEFRTPLWLGDAARAVLRLSREAYCGRLHCGGPERMSRLEMGQRLAALLGIGNPRLKAVSRLEFPSSEPRPADLSLDSSKLQKLFPDIRRGALDQRCLQADAGRPD